MMKCHIESANDKKRSLEQRRKMTDSHSLIDVILFVSFLIDVVLFVSSANRNKPIGTAV